jgi:hypothetical protein
MKKDNPRRSFLKSAVAFGAGIGLFSLFGKKAKAQTSEKVKMLTPDGKLVEIDRSQIEKEVTPGRASNKEVMDWMKPKDNR